MIGLIIILAIAYACARGIENGMDDISKAHKQRLKKAAKKNGRKTGAKLAAWTATGATATGTFWRGFRRGWRREWPKARKRAAAKFGRYQPEPEQTIGHRPDTDGTPITKTGLAGQAERVPVADPRPVKAPHTQAPTTTPEPPVAEARALILIKNDTQTTPESRTDTTTGAPVAIAQIQEITGVDTLKAFAARTASEANVSAEEAGALAQRAAEELASIEAAIEQATALEFGDDGGTLPELAAMRDQAIAAKAAADAFQAAMVDKAALASQTSKNIHDRHSNIQEAVHSQGGRMASKQAYTADA
ncbi:MAG TPA: hypothetical protein VGL02_15765 [Streptomyces sp.]